MDFSLLRSIAASITTNLSSFRRQAKRLQKASPDVFGQPFPLTTCQEAIARSHGFRAWKDVANVMSRMGVDRSLPFWHHAASNDAVQPILDALYTADLELLDHAAVAVLGKAKDALPVAVTLWIAEMSTRRVPGVILVDTDKPTVQDTELWPVAQRLKLDDVFQQFRVIDLRERPLSMVLSAAPMDWTRSVLSAMSAADAETLERSGGRHLLELAMQLYAESDNWTTPKHKDVGVNYLKKAALFVKNPSWFTEALAENLNEQAATRLRIDVNHYHAQVPTDVIERLSMLVTEIDERGTRTGTLLHSESRHRPVVALWSRDNAASVAFAACVYGMFLWPFVASRECRPAICFSDTGAADIPRFVTFGTRTAIVSAGLKADSECWSGAGMKGARLVRAEDGTLDVAGKRVSLAAPEAAPAV